MNITTPVALLVFNRPRLTARVFEAIARAKPKTLFIAADGPRFPEEAALCEETRAIVQRVDWTCDVHTDFSTVNLGCARRQSSAIDWVFSKAEDAILLEDDTLPAQSFFSFCQELLDRYRDDTRVMHVGGANLQFGRSRTEQSYYFSKYTGIWGWATWRRAWKHYDFLMKDWPEFKRQGLMKFVCQDPVERDYWTQNFDSMHADALMANTWDSQWLFACWRNNGLAIVPNVNLVSNIGFGADATHTTQVGRNSNIPLLEIGSLSHPNFLVDHRDADLCVFREGILGERQSLLIRALLRVQRAIQ